MSLVASEESSRPYRRVTGLVTTGSAGTIITIDPAARRVKLYVSVTCRVAIGTSATTVPTNTAAVQTLTAGDATGGTFTLAFQGQTTSANAFNISAGTLQTNLRALSSIGSAGVTCAGGALNAAPITITFDGTTLSGVQPLMTIDGTSLTGGASATTRVPTIATSTAGVTNGGKIQGGNEEIYTVLSYATDKYLYLIADSGTGTYSVSFYK